MTKMHFKKQFEVHYYEVNKYQEATPISILNYLEEAAIAHSETVGFGIGALKEQGIGWVLNRWHLNIDRYPNWGEHITIETWPCKFERFYATREFYIKDSNEQVLGKATSLWIFLNIYKKRPLRIPTEIMEAYGVDPHRAIEMDFNCNEIEDSDTETKEFAIKRADIDTNDHVNNTRYIEWIMETVPHETYDNFYLSSLAVQYKHEARYGGNICISNQQIKNDTGNHFLHSIKDTTTGKILAIAETGWRKRKEKK